MLLKRFLPVISLLLLLLPIPGYSAQASDSVGDWMGRHARLVWLQDHGNGADSMAQGRELMLFGYDSLDGKGERPLISKVDNFFMPMFTPDGQQVVFSNRLLRKIFLFDWQSGRVTDLGDGIAVAVWQDPKPSFFFKEYTTWVYCLAGPEAENEKSSAQPLYRFPLDKPKKKELIWRKTEVTWETIRLSRDGSILGGLFPWPYGGVIFMKDKSLHPLGKGCWTSLSPDNSMLFWIFDGKHRNVEMHDVVTHDKWQVNINGAPGIGGYEVYHPRWSNHPRYFVLSGPYKKGEGGNKIRGGGEKVELHIGRFDPTVRVVEDWLQVTANNRADFYPDLWVAGGNQIDLSREKGRTVAAFTEKWPSSSRNLIFLWENARTTNQLADNSPVGFMQCGIDLHNKALFTRDFALDTRGGFGAAVDSRGVIAGAVARAKHLTLELFVTPKKQQRAAILSFNKGKELQLQLRQENDSLSLVSPLRQNTTFFEGVFLPGKPVHLALNFDGQELSVAVNGESRGKTKFFIDFADFSFDGVTLGDESGDLHASLSHLALYNAPLLPTEIQKNNHLILQDNEKRSATERIVMDGRLLETTTIPATEALGAYRRALVVNTYSVTRVRSGEYKQDRILVAEWAILDGRIIKSYPEPRREETLVLEKFSEHKELEGERQMIDIFEPELEMYYRLPEWWDN